MKLDFEYIDIGKLRNWLARLFYRLMLIAIGRTQDEFEEDIFDYLNGLEDERFYLPPTIDEVKELLKQSEK